MTASSFSESHLMSHIRFCAAPIDLSSAYHSARLPRVGLGKFSQGSSDEELMSFLDDDAPGTADDHEAAKQRPWQILVVDDEPQVHEATVIALKRTRFGDRPCAFLHAYSAAEALQIINSPQEIHLVLLDVIMETRDAGLRLVRKVRDGDIRPGLKIVIRSGQPGWEHETQVSNNYPIDGYIQKAEQTYELMVDTIGPLLLGNAPDPFRLPC
ncbi:response regulator [Uliginosibacterium gangwonense]|uniref:response regulator n=1 Tax=Uliginosibacterium gangwonense TaxID=392736 RepID=UPI000382949B|nr:response regulator [Uliginosibacterium gangwonense]